MSFLFVILVLISKNKYMNNEYITRFTINAYLFLTKIVSSTNNILNAHKYINQCKINIISI